MKNIKKDNLINVKFIIEDKSDNVKTLYKTMNDRDWIYITKRITIIDINIQPSEINNISIRTKHHAHPDNPVWMKVDIEIDGSIDNSQTIHSIGGGVVLMKLKKL